MNYSSIDYCDTLLRQNSGTAEKINKIRWDFVKEIKPRLVLDYGSGPGWFRAFRPKGVEIDTFDLGPWPQTGSKCRKYDLITLWDVIEHFKEFGFLEDLLKTTKFVAISTPILPLGTDLKTWKHFKPGEHIIYFTKETLIALFLSYGFKLIKFGYPEVESGIRTDILSVLFKKTPGSIY